MFLVLSFITVGILVSTAIVGGAGVSLRLAWVGAMLAPEWLARNVGSMTIDLRLIILLIAVPVAVFSDRFIKRLVLADALVLSLVIAGLSSLYKSNLFVPSEILSVLAIWAVPYVLGRILISSLSDLDRLIPYAVGVCLFLSTWSMVEAVTHVNPINAIAGRTGSRISEQNQRFNLRRAEGPLGHPIYFGMSIAMLFPWTLEAARRSRQRRMNSALRISPFVCAAGVFCTVSRGPMLVMIATGAIALFFAFPNLRMPMAAAGVLAVVAVAVAWPVVVDELQRLGGEESGEVVTIDGQKYEYSGTKHRQLLYIVYADAISDAGLLGHGKWGGKVQHQTYIESHLRRTFRSIDNHYLLLVLNWGIVGLIAFCAFGFIAISDAFWLAFSSDSEYRVLIGGLAGAAASVMLMLLTVWFSSGFGFPWLCTLGMLTSCRVANARSTFQTAMSPLLAGKEFFNRAQAATYPKDTSPVSTSLILGAVND